MKVARLLLAKRDRPLCFWRGDFYERAPGHWARTDAKVLKNWIYRETEAATWSDDGKTKAWNPTPIKVAQVLDALGTGLVLYAGDEVRGIFTMDGRVRRHGQRKAEPHTPETFNLSCLPFHYDPDAKCPNLLAFLNSSLPKDRNAHLFLQEWFGYVIDGSTSLHKLANLNGQPRSGKSTLSRVLEALVGEGNHTAIELEDLSSQFDKASLIGKKLAVISEPDWKSASAQRAVEPIKRITGGDPIHIARKYDPDGWYGVIGARLMVVSNDPPRLMDRSGALAARMINVHFPESFVGREDLGLEDRLMAELPGILNWALEGLARLERNGHFTIPDSHQELQDAFREWSDPDGTFIAEAGQSGPGMWCTRDEVHAAFHAWNRKVGRDKDSTDAIALINRMAARKGLEKKRHGKNREWRLYGFCPNGWEFEDARGNKHKWSPRPEQHGGQPAPYDDSAFE